MSDGSVNILWKKVAIFSDSAVSLIGCGPNAMIDNVNEKTSVM